MHGDLQAAARRRRGKGAWLEKRKRRTQSARNIFEHGKGGPAAAAASGAESGAADAEDTEGTAAQAINQEFKVAVGYSSAEDPKRAATESYRQLRTKLSNATPHAVIVAMSGIYDFPTVVSTLRDLLRYHANDCWNYRDRNHRGRAVSRRERKISRSSGHSR